MHGNSSAFMRCVVRPDRHFCLLHQRLEQTVAHDHRSARVRLLLDCAEGLFVGPDCNGRVIVRGFARRLRRHCRWFAPLAQREHDHDSRQGHGCERHDICRPRPGCAGRRSRGGFAAQAGRLLLRRLLGGSAQVGGREEYLCFFLILLPLGRRLIVDESQCRKERDREQKPGQESARLGQAQNGNACACAAICNGECYHSRDEQKRCAHPDREDNGACAACGERAYAGVIRGGL